MASQLILWQTATPGSPRKPGRSFYDFREYSPECQQRSTQRPTAKRNGLTRQSKHTSECSSARNRTTGYDYCRWPSSPTTTQPPWAIVCPRSTLTMASTRQPWTPRQRNHSSQRAQSTPTGCTPCTTNPEKGWKTHRSECADTLTRRERNPRHTKWEIW